ncbi:hypothetical protein KAFR_0H02090 [Kazachstania africana CBS 2517]|uniref:Uncharacterized protein n=1 Tax=Kazachstania africana (strain ATCC 22294 / BCRC 22015 / CBS 2517 / CECT 1963 / NBRC 1671 / NRRL Y-8276) TaxID=1071382 RepID=H2AZ62_KAZAF|nr:hypothetical protein KAFR_0H02090 [Kazachstania africana CBS 2517]CCF59618.1 hypothetical protein KAFR_0H02090 [Kazachstania africana CBS 2517]
MNIEIEHVQLDFIKQYIPQDILPSIISLQVCSNIFTFAIKKSNYIFVINLDKPSEINSIKLPFNSGGNAINETIIITWLNANGTRLFMKTNLAKYYVLDIPTQKTFIVKRLNKNYNIKCIQWLDDNSLLAGTSNGHIYSILFNNINDPVIKVLWKSKMPASISGVLYNGGNGNILVAIDNTLIYWKSDVFSSPIKTLQEIKPTEIKDFTYDNTNTTQFKNKFTTNNKNKFAWTTDVGIVYGNLDVDSTINSFKIYLNVELPNSDRYQIKDLILSDYHMVLLRGSLITIINQLSNKIIFEQSIDEGNNEKFLHLVKDNVSLTYWCFSNMNIYELVLSDESKSIWKLLCEENRFEEALKLGGLNTDEIQLIYYNYGKYLLESKKDPQSAALQFGKTNAQSIASIVLDFMSDIENENSFNAIQTYLITKLENSRTETNKILLSSWIIWNFNKILYEKDDPIIEKDAKTFLQKHVTSLDKETVYEITRDNHQLLLYFADLIKDYNFLMSYWISRRHWNESLKIMSTFNVSTIIYKYSTILLINAPHETIVAWMKLKGLIDPVKLIPSVLNYFTNYLKLGPNNDENFALTYLNWCIGEYPKLPKIIYNTMCYMMITTIPSINSYEDRNIMSFLDQNENRLDKDFILRLSLKLPQRIKVSIFLLKSLKLYDEAVTMSLENKLFEMAKDVINRIEDKELEEKRLKKKLWLKYCKARLSNLNGEDGAKNIINSILADSNGIIQINDILPVLNNVITIANIKDELIKNLQNHSNIMKSIATDIEKTNNLKKLISSDIKELNTRTYQIMEPGNSCKSCDKLLQNRKFLVFPCKHCFHTDCLIRLILNSNDFQLKSQIQNFQQKLSKKSDVKNKRQDLSELESILTKKCVLCSDININTIDNAIDLNNEVGINKWNKL